MTENLPNMLSRSVTRTSPRQTPFLFVNLDGDLVVKLLLAPSRLGAGNLANNALPMGSNEDAGINRSGNGSRTNPDPPGAGRVVKGSNTGAAKLPPLCAGVGMVVRRVM